MALKSGTFQNGPEGHFAWLNLLCAGFPATAKLEQNTMQTNSEARGLMYMYILSWHSDLELRTCI